MTPEIEAALEDIGWQTVRRISPQLAMFLAADLEGGNGTALAENDAQAREHANLVEGIFRDLFEAWQRLEGLPSSIRKNISFASVSIAEMKAHAAFGAPLPNTLSELETALTRTFAGLESTVARLRFLGGESRRGSPRVLRTHAVAYACARIYLIGMGEMPTANNGPEGQGITGLYGRTVSKVFDILGLGFDAVGPCKQAIERLEKLSDAEWYSLMALRCPLTRQDVDIDLKKIF